ncbi:MAG: hypothetical protein KDB27_11915 [Planctomycetales bacterium]|nr:hypothetical protein [Planctomycetales bacterium]
MSTRRRSLASIVSRPGSLLASSRPTNATSDAEVPTEESPSRDSTRKFGLGTLLLIVSLLCVWLGVLRADLEMGIAFGCISAVVMVKLNRARIRATFGDSTCDQASIAMRYIGGAIAGAILGQIGGVVVELFLLGGSVNLVTAVKIGAGIGISIGIVYPRATTAVLLFAPVGW